MHVKNKLQRIVLAFGLFALITLSGCASYIVREAQPVKLEKKSRIGIVVKGKYASPTLASFMSASLLSVGFSAKVIDPSELIPEDVLTRIDPDYRYSFLEALVMSMYSGKAEVKGDKALLKDLFAVNDIKESNIRLEDLIALIESFRTKWDLEYLMVIEQNAKFTYTIRITELTTKTIAFVYFIDANEAGWEKVVAPLKESEEFSSSASTKGSDAYVEIQFSEHIANALK